ncbi:hypothetical protein [Thiocapsa imhoffii]|uniref:hypothetical protein n=1 Tax=Thiocapsa imhoffii TaxID=382777 RepID=UPI001F5B582A|nr:hypothetical protein [Thiocapsa imhoffii]
MIIAVIPVRVMEMAFDQIVDMIPVRYRLVPAAGSMHVTGVMTSAVMRRRALIGIGRSHRNDVLVDMVSMRMMEMPVVQVIDVAVVLDRRVPATGAMFMIVIGVFLAAHRSRPPEGVVTASQTAPPRVPVHC